jgi:hypothetical protein
MRTFSFFFGAYESIYSGSVIHITPPATAPVKAPVEEGRGRSRSRSPVD